jgi:hypothetical protein
LKKRFICIFIIALSNYSIVAQNVSALIQIKDTVYKEPSPLFFRTSALFSRKNSGTTLGIGHYLVRKQINKHKKSGAIKNIKKDKLFCVDLGYYYQAGLHQNWFLTATYSLRRTGNKGFYTELSPMLGISRTFLSDETYTVKDDGTVSLKRFSGNWYLVSGFATGIGKTFNEKRNFFLKEIHLTIYTQFLYPNFGFIALKPFWQLGTSFNIEKITRLSKKISKHK